MAKINIPSAALDERFAIVGTSGSGKTYAAGTAVERLLADGKRVIIVDPLDVWWGLRLTPAGKPSRFDLPIFGGRHADIAITEAAGGLVGEACATMTQSCIVSLADLGTKSAERRFMLAFLDALYRKANGEPVHLVFDEADLWAPQNSSEPKLQSLMEQIVRRGRVKGFIPWLITQRPAVLSKDVLSQADGLIAMKLTASQDRNAIGAWIDGQADREQGKAILASLPAMKRGEGVAWIPGMGFLETVTFPVKATFDSSRTPTRGEVRTPTTMRPLDLDKLRGQMARIEDEVKANDPKALKAEVERLKRELAKAERAMAAPPAPERIVANADDVEEARKQGELAGIAIGIARARDAINKLRVDAPLDVKNAQVAIQRRKGSAPTPLVVHVIPTGDIPTSCAKPLAALVSVYPSSLTEPQWALSAGYKKSGGTWGTYKSRLIAAGLVERRDGRWFATDAGAKALGDVPRLPDAGPELVRYWASRLPSVSKIAEALIAAYPRAMDKHELAEAVGMSASGGSFGTYLTRLSGPGLIDRSGGMIRLTDEVMGGPPL